VFAVRFERVWRRLTGEVGRAFQRADQAHGGSYAFSSDVECGAVVDGRADDGESQGDVDASFEIEQLQRDVALVVVHADDGVEFFAADGQVKDGVGREGSFHGHSLLLRPLDRGPYLLDFFIAENTVLAGVGIQARHRNARIGPEAAHGVRGEAQNGADTVLLGGEDGVA